MDSLLCKINSLRVWVPGSTGKPCETSAEASQSAPRSVQVCVCRSPGSSQLKAGPIMSSTSPTEESISKDGASALSFNPLPLLSSHSAIPEPLKFLWFNRKGQQATERRENNNLASTGQAGDDEESMLSSLVESEEDHNKSEVPGPRDAPVLMEPSWETNIDDGKSSLSSETHVEEAGNSEVNHSAAALPLRDWVSKIAALWTDPNYFRTRSAPMLMPFSSSEPMGVSCDTSDTDPDETSRHPLLRESGNDDLTCSLDAAESCSLEVPYTKVLHTKESFSEFLQDASLYDMKAFAQLAFLCDMAYTIPDIQPGQLMKYHRLKLVTSSLVKKAEAEVKAKESELSKKLSASDTETAHLNASNGCVDSQSQSTFPADGVQSEACSEETSNTHLNSESDSAAVPDVSCVSEENGAVSISDFDSRLKQSSSVLGKLESSSIVRKLEDNHCMDQDSMMAIAPATVATVADEETELEVAKDLPSTCSCPCEWFVCDEQSTNTRLFVIQGSESLASWQANLFFEPTQFEGLHVFVHRGIYEAAKALYDQVLPEVLYHFSTFGDLARVRFTGHSLGGSLAALLALMLQLRGVLPRTAILPIVTFGSPFIMCGGDYLLRKMQLSQNHIQSVIMHRDVVPRAFACDYPDHVAEVLKKLNGRFRDHPCLNNQKLLYSPMGQLYILQPDVRAAPSHPLLPDGDGLYALRHPLNGDEVNKATELRGAQRAFLNMPHPLDILADPGAYGFDGTVSRDHDPRSYSKAIHVVLKHRVKKLRRTQREQRRQLMWPSVMRGSSVATPSEASLDSSVSREALTSAVSRSVSCFQTAPTVQ